MFSSEQLSELKSRSLEQKISITQTRIIEWYLHYKGDVYVSFSGGKDSTVLLDICRRMYPDITAVFCNTGMEFPEVINFIRTKEDVLWLKPKMSFIEIVEKYGYPVVSKEQSQFIYEYRTTKSEKLKGIRWDGNKYNMAKVS